MGEAPSLKIKMDIFNSNRRLEELAMFGIDWGIFLRHDMEGPIAPFLYLKNGKEQHVRMLMTDGDPLEYAKEVLKKEEKPFQQFVIGIEGYLKNDDGERVDAIIVHGFDTSQEKGVLLGQMFSPKESGKFKKIDKVAFLGKPDLILPLKPEKNSDHSVEEIGVHVTALSGKESDRAKCLAVFTHDNPSVIGHTVKQFLRSMFSSEDSKKLSGDFEIQIPDNCVQNANLLAFLVKNAITEEMAEDSTKNWIEKHRRPVSIQAKYNGKMIFEAKSSQDAGAGSAEANPMDLSSHSVSELDAKFVAILQTPNARTNIEALTKMSELLEEYKKRNILTPDERAQAPQKAATTKKWWEFWK